MLRIAKIALMLSVCAWGLIAALHNFLNWGETVDAVAGAAAMVLIDGGAQSWQATSNPIVVWAGVLFIVLSKLATAGLCGYGAWQMWQVRNADAVSFDASKSAGLTGCAIAVLMLFGGFIVLGESWYEMWRAEAYLGPVLGGAFRYGVFIGVIGVFVAQPER